MRVLKVFARACLSEVPLLVQSGRMMRAARASCFRADPAPPSCRSGATRKLHGRRPGAAWAPRRRSGAARGPRRQAGGAAHRAAPRAASTARRACGNQKGPRTTGRCATTQKPRTCGQATLAHNRARRRRSPTKRQQARYRVLILDSRYGYGTRCETSCPRA